jgi:hypothetical protein
MNRDTENIRSENITPEMISQWKRKYPDGVYKLEAPGLFGYVRMPTNEEIKINNRALKNSRNQRLPMKELMRSIWLGGDLAIIKKDDMYVYTESQIITMLDDKNKQVLKKIKQL